MKKLLATLIISALLATSAQADKREDKRGVKIDQVIAAMQLDVTQANSLKTLMESHRANRKAMREQGNENKEQRQALREQHRQALLEVLGSEKMREFKEIMQKNRLNKKSKKD